MTFEAMTTPAHKTGRTAPTPGPWKPHSNPTSNYGLEVVADNAIKAKRVVCRVGGPDREANARLIGAAPELLETLEDCREFLRDLTDPDKAASGPNVIASFANAVSLRLRVVNAIHSARDATALSATRTTGDQS